MLDPQQLGEASPKCRGKLAALIRSRTAGTLNLATHVEIRAATESSAAMDFRGVASSHLDDLSTTVNRSL
jgi:hypothetical protein